MEQKSKLHDILEKIGLSENESRVYLAAIALGPTTATQLSRESEVKRTTIYPVVESLQRKGLMREELQGLKTAFIAEDPQRLENILDERNKEFKSLFPEFKSLYTLEGKEAVIKYYDTEEGMRNVYRELLEDLRSGDDYFVIGDPKRYDTSNEKFFKDFIKKRLRISLNAKLLLTYSDVALEYKKYEKNYGEEVKLLPAGVELDVNLVVTDKKIVIHQIVQPHIAMVIENKAIVGMQHTLFKLLWEKY